MQLAADHQMCSFSKSSIVVAFAFTLFCNLSAALAQTNEEEEGPATPCDRLATRDVMPGAVAPAVAFNEIDVTVALSACEEAVNHYPSSQRLRFLLSRVQMRAGKFALALPSLVKLIEEDYTPAQQMLGSAYLMGDGVDKDAASAAALFQTAADAGDALAAYCLGALFRDGLGVPRDRAKAVLWLKKAAGQGLAIATNALTDLQNSSPIVGRPVRSQGRAVFARGLGVVPGALICEDHATLSMVFHLYSSNWERSMQERLTRGASRLVNGPSSSPDLNDFRCAMIKAGSPMTLESNAIVPVVSAVDDDGKPIRGVTLVGMFTEP